MAQKKSFEQPVSPESCWIKYQLDLHNIKYDAVAKKAHCTTQFVSLVILGKRKSENVGAVIAEMLGYQSYKHLWADAFINSGERKAV
jgi:hypothetical protein